MKFSVALMEMHSNQECDQNTPDDQLLCITVYGICTINYFSTYFVKRSSVSGSGADGHI